MERAKKRAAQQQNSTPQGEENIDREGGQMSRSPTQIGCVQIASDLFRSGRAWRDGGGIELYLERDLLVLKAEMARPLRPGYLPYGFHHTKPHYTISLDGGRSLSYGSVIFQIFHRLEQFVTAPNIFRSADVLPFLSDHGVNIMV